MSLRRLLPLVLLLGCAGESMKVRKGEPQTAREKMLAEEKAHPSDPDEGGTGKKWNGWRYQGDRKDCFYVFGKKCFKSEKAACQAAKCKAPSKCEGEGAAPTIMSCSKK